MFIPKKIFHARLDTQGPMHMLGRLKIQMQRRFEKTPSTASVNALFQRQVNHSRSQGTFSPQRLITPGMLALLAVINCTALAEDKDDYDIDRIAMKRVLGEMSHLFDEKEEISKTIKDQIKNIILKPLAEDGVSKISIVVPSGENRDSYPRRIVVNFQNIVESWAVQSKIQLRQSYGMVHTRFPSTPLCSELNDERGLLSPDQLTVEVRKDSMRRFSEKWPLLIFYTEKRGTGSQKYFENLAKKSRNIYNIHLEEYGEIPKDIQGASYFFKLELEGQIVTLFFSLRGAQKGASGDQLWTVWFGSVSNEEIKKRIESVIPLVDKVPGTVSLY